MIKSHINNLKIKNFELKFIFFLSFFYVNLFSSYKIKVFKNQ